MGALKFITAGSINDGKSTLLGRLMLDLGKVPSDIGVKIFSQKEINLAHLTDGLKKERAEGITIDVSYKYFLHNERRYVLVDAPGHFEYTKNMFTGASDCDVMLILIDATKGLTAQTRLHLQIAHMLRTPQVFILVNKMDLVNYSILAYNHIVRTVTRFTESLKGLEVKSIIPISAVQGDNVIHESKRISWYPRVSLFQQLEELEIKKKEGLLRINVQHSLEHKKTPYYFCRVSGGNVDLKTQLYTYPENKQVKLKAIYVSGKKVIRTNSNEPVALELNSKNKLKRGDVLTIKKQAPQVVRSATATICCLSPEGLKNRKQYMMMRGSQMTIISLSGFKLETKGQKDEKQIPSVKVNEIVSARLTFKNYLSVDYSEDNFDTAKFILVDKRTKNTVAAGYFKRSDS